MSKEKSNDKSKELKGSEKKVFQDDKFLYVDPTDNGNGPPGVNDNGPPSGDDNGPSPISSGSDDNDQKND